MNDMIRRQAVAGRATLRNTIEGLAADPVPAPTSSVAFVGLGTSYHVALGAAYAARSALPDLTVTSATSFDVLDRGLTPAPEVAVVYSASANTALTVAAQRWLLANGVRVILVTAEPTGPSREAATRTLETQHSREESWTHTVSYTSALVATAALLDHWRGETIVKEEAEDALGDALSAALATEHPMVAAAEEFTGCDRFLLVAPPACEAGAREGALKLREAAGKFVATCGVEELLHGVIPSLGERTVVLAYSATPLERRRALEGLVAVGKVGAKGRLLDTSGGDATPEGIPLPAVDGPVAAAIHAIPVQLLAYWIALSDGQNPDVMRLDDRRVFEARSSFGI